MNRLFVILFIISQIFAENLHGQEASDVFSIGGTTSTDRIKSVTTDSLGNIYLLGQCYGTMQTNGQSINTSINTSGRTFVCKLDSNKNLIWLTEFDYITQNSKVASKIAIDASGNVYITDQYWQGFNAGSYQFNTITFGYVTYKLNSNGSLLWANDAGGNSIQISNFGNSIEIMQYHSVNDSVGNEPITNPFGTLVWLDFDGNYIDHFQIDNPSFGTEFLVGRNTDNLFYGFRRQYPENVYGTLSSFELFTVDSLANIINVTLTHYSSNNANPASIIQDPISNDYYMTLWFYDRTPLNSSDPYFISRLGILRLDENFNLLDKIYLSGDGGSDGASKFSLSIVDDGLYLSSRISIPFGSITWTSLGQNNYIFPEDYKLIIAKLSKDLNVKWYKEIPEKVYNNDINSPLSHNGNLLYYGNHKGFSMDSATFVPYGSYDIFLLDIVDNDSTNIKIKGSIFHDVDQDGIKTSIDDTIAYMELSSSASTFDAIFTDEVGDFNISGINGSQIIKSENVPTYWSRSTPDSIIINNTINDTIIENINFGMYPTPGISDLEVNLQALTSCNPGFDVQYLVEVCNVGTVISEGIFYLKQSPYLSFISSEITPDSISGDTLFFNFNNLEPLDCIQFKVLDSVANSLNILGTNLLLKLSAIPLIQDTVLQNNDDFLLHNVTGSYDPNDITVNPICGITPNFILNGLRLEYLIRFQNTGSDTAIFVTIKDTLSSLFDLNSFQFTGSSHDVDFSILNGVLVIQYDSIMLTDASTNFSLSTGYFSYSVQLNSNGTLGSSANNSAAIFFDYNAPIITNEVTTNIVESGSLIQTTFNEVTCADNGSINYEAFCSNGGLWLNLDNTGYTFNENGFVDSLEAGLHTLSLTNGLDTVSVNSFLIDYNPISTSNLISICSGDSVMLSNDYQFISGVYIDTLQNTFGCDSLLITTLDVNSTPIVTMGQLAEDTVCINSPNILLPAGTPSGGGYTGIGISGNTFNPELTGIGEFYITYSYTDGEGCSSSDSSSIYVDECLNMSTYALSQREISVGPNPFSTFTLIEFGEEFNGEIDLLLTNLLGQKVLEISKFKGDSFILHRENLENGVYNLICLDNQSGRIMLSIKLILF